MKIPEYLAKLDFTPDSNLTNCKCPFFVTSCGSSECVLLNGNISEEYIYPPLKKVIKRMKKVSQIYDKLYFPYNNNIEKVVKYEIAYNKLMESLRKEYNKLKKCPLC